MKTDKQNAQQCAIQPTNASNLIQSGVARFLSSYDADAQFNPAQNNPALPQSKSKGVNEKAFEEARQHVREIVDKLGLPPEAAEMLLASAERKAREQIEEEAQNDASDSNSATRGYNALQAAKIQAQRSSAVMLSYYEPTAITERDAETADTLAKATIGFTLAQLRNLIRKGFADTNSVPVPTILGVELSHACSDTETYDYSRQLVQRALDGDEDALNNPKVKEFFDASNSSFANPARLVDVLGISDDINAFAPMARRALEIQQKAQADTNLLTAPILASLKEVNLNDLRTSQIEQIAQAVADAAETEEHAIMPRMGCDLVAVPESQSLTLSAEELDELKRLLKEKREVFKRAHMMIDGGILDGATGDLVRQHNDISRQICELIPPCLLEHVTGRKGDTDVIIAGIEQADKIGVVSLRVQARELSEADKRNPVALTQAARNERLNPSDIADAKGTPADVIHAITFSHDTPLSLLFKQPRQGKTEFNQRVYTIDIIDGTFVGDLAATIGLCTYANGYTLSDDAHQPTWTHLSTYHAPFMPTEELEHHMGYWGMVQAWRLCMSASNVAELNESMHVSIKTAGVVRRLAQNLN